MMMRMRMRMNIPVAYYVALIFCLVTTNCKVANGFIGVTWGRQSYQRLVPSMVVDLILQNEVKHARIYSGTKDVLDAFAGSGIDLTVGIFKPQGYDSETAAERWVDDKITKYDRKTNIRRVFIGNYVFKNNLLNSTARETAINALSLIQNALNKKSYGDVKASLTFSLEELEPNITRPSEAQFKPDLVPDIRRALDILKENNSPFVVQIFPAQFTNDNKKDLAFAFPDNNNSSLYVHDVIDGADVVYTHAFEFVYDSFAWALRKEGFENVSIVVDQACWATDGFTGLNVETAERFFKGLLPWAAGNNGTHMRPGKPIDLYVHSLTDETIVYAKNEAWARHWGIYRSNGVPKYKIDLTGQARDIYPVEAKGIMRMPDRWCVLKHDTKYDKDKFKRLEEEICGAVDCTSLADGGSCSNLSPYERMSYVFNVNFQTNFQKEGYCDNERLGEVIMDNPSVRDCVFTVEVVEGKQDNLNLLASEVHGADRGHVFFVLVISIFSAAFLT